MDKCSAFIVIVTPNSYKSEYVQHELAYARNNGKRIFPLLLEGEMWLALSAIQYEDVRGSNFPSREFYETLSEFSPRRLRHILKSTDAQYIANEIASRFPKGHVQIGNAKYGYVTVLIANFAIESDVSEKQTNLIREDVPKAIATTIGAKLNNRQKALFRLDGWDNIVYNETFDPGIKLNPERYGKSWPVYAEWLSIAYEIVNACLHFGMSPTEIEIKEL